MWLKNWLTTVDRRRFRGARQISQAVIGKLKSRMKRSITQCQWTQKATPTTWLAPFRPQSPKLIKAPSSRLKIRTRTTLLTASNQAICTMRPLRSSLRSIDHLQPGRFLMGSRRRIIIQVIVRLRTKKLRQIKGWASNLAHHKLSMSRTLTKTLSVRLWWTENLISLRKSTLFTVDPANAKSPMGLDCMNTAMTILRLHQKHSTNQIKL